MYVSSHLPNSVGFSGSDNSRIIMPCQEFVCAEAPALPTKYAYPSAINMLCAVEVEEV